MLFYFQMTTIMNQVTCSLCYIKIDEINWNDHLMSTKHLQNCKENKEVIIAKFFNIIFKTYHYRKDLYNMEDEYILDFWESYFETKLPKEKYDIILSNPNNNSELEINLTSDLLYFMNNDTHGIEETFLEALDKILICRLCNEEVLKSQLYKHITSKEHINTENYFIRKCMTYCMQCNMEIKNDEWSTHLNSNWHLGKGVRYCDVCKRKYHTHVFDHYLKELERSHLESDSHKKHQEGLVFYPK